MTHQEAMDQARSEACYRTEDDYIDGVIYSLINREGLYTEEAKKAFDAHYKRALDEICRENGIVQ